MLTLRAARAIHAATRWAIAGAIGISRQRRVAAGHQPLAFLTSCSTGVNLERQTTRMFSVKLTSNAMTLATTGPDPHHEEAHLGAKDMPQAATRHHR